MQRCVQHARTAARVAHAKIGRGLDTSTVEIEKLNIGAIHGAFKYPEGDGGPNLDYEWIASDQSAQIAKAIPLDLAPNGYAILKHPPDPTRSQALHEQK
jgi:hypothetical protein